MNQEYICEKTYVHSHSVTKILRTLEPLGLFKSSKKFYFIFFVLFPSQWHQTRASQRSPRQHQCPSCITMAWKTIQRPKRHSFQLCFSKEIKWDVEEFLKDTFPRKKQIILAPYHGGNSLAPYHERNSLAPYHGRISFFLDKNSFERSLGREMAYVNSASDEKFTSAVLENLSARNSSAQAKFPLFRL